MREAEAKRGTNKSQAVLITIRVKIEPKTAAILAFPVSVAVRLRLSRMIGRTKGIRRETSVP